MNLSEIENNQETIITLTREKFNNFLRILRMIENACNDVEIVDNRILQKTNDKYCIIDVDLSSVFNQPCSFAISKIKNKNQLFKILESNDDNASNNDEDLITIKIDDKFCIFEDNISELKFTKPITKYLDNTFISDDSVLKLIDVKDENLLFEQIINSNLVKRIRNILEGFNMDHITCKVNNDKINFNVSTLDKQNSSDVIKNMALNRDEGSKYKFAIQAFAFTIEGNEVNITMYKTSSGKIVTYFFDQEIFEIPVKIIGRAQLQEK